MDRSEDKHGHDLWTEPVGEAHLGDPPARGTAGRARHGRDEAGRRADESEAEERDTRERESEGTPREEGSRMSDIMKRVNDALHRSRRKETPEE